MTQNFQFGENFKKFGCMFIVLVMYLHASSLKYGANYTDYQPLTLISKPI